MKTIKINKYVTASLDVDAQCGFSPLCPNELPVPGGDEIVPELNLQATKARLRIGSKDWHCLDSLHTATPENPQFSVVGAPNVDIRWNIHCIGGSRGADLLPGLPHWLDYDFFIFKGQEKDSHPYGACFTDLQDTRSTGLIEYLKQNGIKQVIVGGLSTEFCVLTTVMQLRKSGFEVILNYAGCRGLGIPTNNGLSSTVIDAIEKMRTNGVVIAESASNIEVSMDYNPIETDPDEVFDEDIRNNY